MSLLAELQSSTIFFMEISKEFKKLNFHRVNPSEMSLH